MQELEEEIEENERDLDDIMKDIPKHKHDKDDGNETDDNVSNEKNDDKNGGWKGIHLFFI